MSFQSPWITPGPHTTPHKPLWLISHPSTPLTSTKNGIGFQRRRAQVEREPISNSLTSFLRRQETNIAFFSFHLYCWQRRQIKADKWVMVFSGTHASLFSSPVLQLSLLHRVSGGQSLFTQVLILAAPRGTDLGQPSGDSPLGSSVEFHTTVFLTQTPLPVLFHTAPRCGASSCCSAPKELTF